MNELERNSLEQFAEVLEGIKDAPCFDRLYTNEDRQRGYTATYRVGIDWYWYSVSGTTEKIAPRTVARALREGKAKRINVIKLSGLEATISHENHWYMIYSGDQKP